MTSTRKTLLWYAAAIVVDYVFVGIALTAMFTTHDAWFAFRILFCGWLAAVSIIVGRIVWVVRH